MVVGREHNFITALWVWHASVPFAVSVLLLELLDNCLEELAIACNDIVNSMRADQANEVVVVVAESEE